MMKKLISGILFLFIGISPGLFPEDNPLYKNNKFPLDKRVEDLLARMNLAEKVDMLSGIGFDTKENKRLGIPAISMNDGPVGVRWGNATAFPAAIAMAASWDTALIYEIAKVIARETKAKGRNYLLGPCVNIQRHPLGGRNFESFGEDPFLASRITVPYIKGIQDQGALASVKHFACNNQEWKRSYVDVRVSERALREIYLPAFRAAVQEADVWTVMSAYNIFRGDYCSENDYLLNDILKKEWGFKGYVVSDWGATHSTVKSANSGLDLEMPFAEFWGPKLLAAVNEGDVKEEVINDKVKRILGVMFKAGLFAEIRKADSTEINTKGNQKIALEAAEKSIVLLKNDGILPLNKNKIKRIAIIGPNAFGAMTGGGGSSMVVPAYSVSTLAGIAKLVGKTTEVTYHPGVAIDNDILAIPSAYLSPANEFINVKGLSAEYFSNTELKGVSVLQRIDPTIDFIWGYDAPHPALHSINDENNFSIRWLGKIKVPQRGKYKFNIIHCGGVRLLINKKLVIDNWKNNPVMTSSGELGFEARGNYAVRVEYFFAGGISQIKLGWDVPGYNGIAEAAKVAGAADCAIICTGLSNRFESESFDRESLEIKSQDALIKAVAKANPHTIVILNSGGPLLINNWLNNVKAVLQAWYPGQEGGNALANILFGIISPAAKLPISFITRQEDSPAFNGYKDPSLKANYAEGIYVGYRYLQKNKIEPLYPFGYGLSYTKFTYSDLNISRKDKNNFVATFILKNIGKFSGAEIAQLYITQENPKIDRPEKELKGFAKTLLKIGEQKTIQIKFKLSDLAFYDETSKSWKVAAGNYKILIGSSSRDLRLSAVIKID